MTSNASPAPAAQRRSARRERARRPRVCDRPERAVSADRVLGRYIDRNGSPREVIARGGAAGSVLVIDRQRGTHDDPRLVAHLAADEPPENAELVCRCYIRDVTAGCGRCRPVAAEDMSGAPIGDRWEAELGTPVGAGGTVPPDRCGRSYVLELIPSRMSIPELRWCRREPQGGAHEPVSLREAIAALESYEPVRTLTVQALARYGRDPGVSTAVLGAELARVQASPIVLNRALREAVLRAVEMERLSMSEIAIRCGRVKRDRRGNQAGETSWLARRVGLLPEGGASVPTPWIHTDVLALIARRGLAISPREIEL
jgi:hypothetical protein